jgi:hypothetical protein
MKVIFGRNDNLDPTMPTSMRSNSAGRVTVYVNGNDNPYIDLQNACILQRTDNYYKTNTVYVQQYVDYWDGGPYITYTVPHVNGSGVADGRDGPWKYTTAATRFGTTLAVAIADAPIPSGTVSPGTSQGTEPGYFFNNDGNWGITGGVAHGTHEPHITGTSPDFGAWTVNMSYAGGVYTVSTPPQLTTDAFQMPPTLGTPGRDAAVEHVGADDQRHEGVGQHPDRRRTGRGRTRRRRTRTGGFTRSTAPTSQPLTGETASTLVLANTHVGFGIQLEVTAANASGSVAAVSATTSSSRTGRRGCCRTPASRRTRRRGGKPGHVETLSRDTGTKRTGTASLKVVTPGVGRVRGGVHVRDAGHLLPGGDGADGVGVGERAEPVVDPLLPEHVHADERPAPS